MLIDISRGMRLQAAARMAASAAAALAQESSEQSPSWSGDLSDQAAMGPETATQPRGGKKARQRQRKQVAAG